MARAAVRGRLTWRGAKVARLREETSTARTLTLRIDEWAGHVPGQHVDLRLTAEDGYTAVRSYSIASAPREAEIELTVDEVPGGEVSSYLVRDVAVGDRL